MSSTTSPSSAEHTVLALPEILTLIARNLPQRHLYSCVQVCHSWSQILIPLLWYRLDTRRKGWRRIIKQYNTTPTSQQETSNWIGTIFSKHGRHIRHLTIHWDVILKEAADTTDCKHLRSLGIIGDIKYVQPYRHERTVQFFWILVQKNPGLGRLVLPPIPCCGSMTSMHASTPDDGLIFTIFSALANLRDLDLASSLLDISALLRSTPQLERLQVFFPDGLSSLDQDYAALRSLVIRDTIVIRTLFRALDRLTGLEELRVRSIKRERFTTMRSIVEERAALVRSRTFPLRSLEVDETEKQTDKYLALVVAETPRLAHFRIELVGRETKSALWNHCYHLDSIHSKNEHLRSLVAGGIRNYGSKEIAKQFWVLVRQNAGLVRFDFPWLADLNRLAYDKEFIFTTLSALENLKTLRLGLLALDDYPGLRSLILETIVAVGDLFKAMVRLPGLEELRAKCILKTIDKEEIRKIMEDSTASPPRLRTFPLRSLEVDYDCKTMDRNAVALVA
ncbi:hypothetical protein BGX23_010745 [Mortierella sp. AD031]|nr:hypothetical protein BGX23_010745 [Mortierella sp. AD031]